jgi:lysophospholipase L1-like esterase
MLRRFLLWYLPIGVAIIACVVFGAGFYSFVRGDTGEPVAQAPSRLSSVAAPRGQVVPLVIGDSLARGTGDDSGLGIGGRLVEDLKPAHVAVKPAVTIAVNGYRTKDVEQQLQSRNVQTLIAQSNVIVISIGGNDLWGSTDWRAVMLRNPSTVMDEVLGNVARIVSTVRGINPTARIFLIGLYNPFVSAPYGAQLSTLVNRWNAKVTERFANDANFTLVETSDLFSHRDRLSYDRFHPNSDGYALIARRIADSL